MPRNPAIRRVADWRNRMGSDDAKTIYKETAFLGDTPPNWGVTVPLPSP
jgi:hypothetical protein